MILLHLCGLIQGSPARALRRSTPIDPPVLSLVGRLLPASSRTKATIPQPRPSSAAAFGGRSRRHPIPRSHGSDRQDIGEEAGGRRRRRGDGAVRALFGVVFLPGRPEDPCRVSLTCRTLGNGQDVYRGLCLVEDAARRPFEQSSAEWERSRLPEVTTAGDGSSFAATCR